MLEKGSIIQTTGFKVAVFTVGTIVLGAILSPPLFWGGKTLVAKGWFEGMPLLDSLHGSMDRARFSRYFNRGILLAALIMLFPTLKWLRAGADGGEKKQSMLDRFQLVRNPKWPIHLVGGFLLAAIPIFLLGWFYLSKGWYIEKDSGKALISVLFSALLTGAVVACLEEFVFRGALTSIFSTIFKPWPLLIGIAIFFAIVHFLKPPAHADITEVGAFSGFHMLGLIFSQFGDWYFLAAEFAVLFSIGILLGYTRLKTKSLWLGIGLHAGWVFGAKTLGPLTKRNFEPAEMMPWLGGNLRVGLASALVVCLTGVVVWFWIRNSVNSKR